MPPSPQIITPWTTSPDISHLGQLHPRIISEQLPPRIIAPGHLPWTISTYNYSRDILGLFIILVEFPSTKSVHVTSLILSQRSISIPPPPENVENLWYIENLWGIEMEYWLKMG